MWLIVWILAVWCRCPLLNGEMMTDDFDIVIDVDRPMFGGGGIALAVGDDCARYIANVMDDEYKRSGDEDAAMIRDSIRAGVGE